MLKESSSDNSMSNKSVRLGLCLLVSSIIFSFFLLVMESPIKYPLFVFAVCLTILLYLRLFSNQIFFKPSKEMPLWIADSILTVFAALLFANTIVNFLGSGVSFVISTLVSSFLPGWVFLRVTNLSNWKISKIELLLLTVLISIGISSVLMTFLIASNIKSPIILTTMYLAISFLSYTKWFRRNDGENRTRPMAVYNLNEILLLCWCTIFFVFTIIHLYPLMADLPGIDIIRHYSFARQVSVSPDIYNSEYPWFHLFLASLITASHPPPWLFHSVVALLSIFLIFSFYVMARSYLRFWDNRSAILATIFFFVFAGFGWFYLIDKELFNAIGNSYLENLIHTYYVSYWDTGIGQSAWIWFWFRPVTLGFSIFFLVISLLQKANLSSIKFMTALSILLITLWQVHFPEFLIFSILVLFLAIIYPRIGLRLKETTLCLLLSIPISVGIELIYNEIFSTLYSPKPYFVLVLVAALSLASYILAKYTWRPKIEIKTRGEFVYLIVIGIYSIFIYYWFTSAESFDIKELIGIYSVPWHFYPVLLGLVGILSIPGFFIVLQKNQKSQSNRLMIFPILLILSFVTGRIITYLNSASNDTGYWERRLLPFLFMSCSILSSVYIPDALDRFKRIFTRPGMTKIPGEIVSIFMISIIIISGATSTFLAIEYQESNANRNKVSDEETKMLDKFIGFFPNSTVLPLSKRSYNLAEFSDSGWRINDLRAQIWPAVYPEIPLYFLNIMNGSSIVLLGNPDLDVITKNIRYREGFVNSFLIKNMLAAQGFADNSGTIVELPSMSPPSQNSETVLVLPEDLMDGDYRYVYLLLSMGGLNYTTAMDSDIITLQKAKNVIVPDEDSAVKVLDLKKKHKLEFDNMIVFNSEGYGQIEKLQSSESHFINTGSRYFDTENNSAFTNHTSRRIVNSQNSSDISGSSERRLNEQQISKPFETPLDVSKYNYLFMNWLGKGDGESYVMRFWSDTNSSSSIRFSDTWNGWRTIVIPIFNSNIRITDANSFGVTFSEISDSDVWSGLERMQIQRAEERGEGPELGTLGPISFGTIDTYNSSIISSQGHYDLPIGEDEYITTYNTSRQSDLKPIQYYKSDSLDNRQNVPFALAKQQDGLKFTYLNIWPILRAIKDNNIDPNAALSTISSNLVKSLFNSSSYSNYGFLKRSSAVSNFLTSQFSAYESVNLNGRITIKTPFVSVDSKNSGVGFQAGNRTGYFGEVQSIDVLGDSNTTITTNEGVINGGRGFYSRVLTNHSSLDIHGKPATITIQFQNGSKTTLTDDTIELELNSTSMATRNPTYISVNGSADFHALYGYGRLSSTIGSQGKNVKVTGIIHFDNVFSDIFTFAENTSFKGEVVRTEPIYKFAELESIYHILSLPGIFRYSFTILLVIIIYEIYVKKRLSSKVRGSMSSPNSQQKKL